MGGLQYDKSLYLNFLAEKADTAGDYTLIDSIVRQGTEPPPHTHTLEDEELMVLEGILEYRFAKQKGLLHAGETVLMPKGQLKLPRYLLMSGSFLHLVKG